MKIKECQLNTPSEGFVDITATVEDAIAAMNVQDGIATIFSPHTTAGITINENADPDVVTDLLLGLRETFPDRPEFRHCEGNSAAHLRAGAVGFSQMVPFQNGKMLLGRWQGIYFCEFDGPRQRRVLITVIGN